MPAKAATQVERAEPSDGSEFSHAWPLTEVAFEIGFNGRQSKMDVPAGRARFRGDRQGVKEA